MSSLILGFALLITMAYLDITISKIRGKAVNIRDDLFVCILMCTFWSLFYYLKK